MRSFLRVLNLRLFLLHFEDRLKNVTNEMRITGTSETGRQVDEKILHPDQAQDPAGRSAKHTPAVHKQRDYFEHGKSSSTDVVERNRVAGDDGEIVIVTGSPVDNEPDSLFDSSETEYGSSASQVRIFIALFEYNPATMSPNSGAIEEELPFSEGQLIKVCRRYVVHEGQSLKLRTGGSKGYEISVS